MSASPPRLGRFAILALATLAGAPWGARGQDNAALKPVAVADSIQAKSGAVNPAPGTIVFEGPPGGGRRVSRGILLRAQPPAPGTGSTWAFQYNRHPAVYALQIIHPWGGGQAIIHLNSTSAGLSTSAKWTDVGYRVPNDSPLQRTPLFDEIFPLKLESEYQVVSRLSTSGAYELIINGKQVATAFVTGASPGPLSLEIPEGTKFYGQGRGELIFKGPDLPMQWSAGWAALFLGPIDSGAPHICRDVKYFTNYVDPERGIRAALPNRSTVASTSTGSNPNATSSADPLTKSLIGAWVKNGDDVITLNEDGTMKSSGGEKGTWKWTKKDGRQFAVTHSSGSTYTLTLAADGQSATGKVTEGPKLGKAIELVKKSAGTSPRVAVAPAPKPAPAPRPSATPSPETQASASELVRTHRSNLVFVTMENASGSGFIASYGNGTYLITNAHVAAGAKGAVFKSLDGTTVQVGAPAVALGHDVFLMALKLGQNSLPVMTGVDEHVTIGDEIVVLGNAEGAGVINTITGKVVGLGPNLVEVDAPFQPGNSGSPMIHLKTGKVIGVATYALIRKYDSATKEAVKEPVIRRFGYRLDSIKKWEPVNWQGFNTQADEMEAIEELTEDLVTFLKDLGDGKISTGSHTNPAIKKRVDAWLVSRSKKLSDSDWTAANRSLLSFLKVTCQSDITAAQPHITYDYFRRQLDEQQKERTEIANYFSKIIDSLRQER